MFRPNFTSKNSQLDLLLLFLGCFLDVMDTILGIALISWYIIWLCGESIVDANTVQNETWILFFVFQSFVNFKLFHRSFIQHFS